MAAIAASPLTAPSSQNSRGRGSLRCRHHSYRRPQPGQQQQEPQADHGVEAQVDQPHHRRPAAGGTLSHPVTFVPGPNPTSSESMYGIRRPP